MHVYTRFRVGALTIPPVSYRRENSYCNIFDASEMRYLVRGEIET